MASIRDAIKQSVYGGLQPHELTDQGISTVTGSIDSHWGYHLILDLSDCNDEIDDEEAVENFLRDLVAELDMKMLVEPIIKRVDNEEEGRGVTGICVITTSHISCHFDDQGRCGYIDIFSCRQFDPKLAINLVEETFKPRNMGKFWLLRDARPYPEKG